MHSPLPSPSIRALAHAHPHPQHLPRQTSGYFPPTHSSGRFHAPSPRAATSTHPCSPYQMHPSSPSYPFPASVSHLKAHQVPLSPARPLATRRGSLRESAIPLKPTAHHRSSASAECEQGGGNGRRRPSFKIDLPPRPIPQELLAESTIFEDRTINPRAAEGKTTLIHGYVDGEAARPVTMIKGTPHPLDLDYNPYAMPDVSFRDPFAQSQDYIILHPEDLPSPDIEDPSSPSAYLEHHEENHRAVSAWSGAGLVGLGYSLNRMRAPTPWIRGKAEDSEWLTGQDVEDMEREISRMAVA